MSKVSSRRLIIDASVALGAGGLERTKEASRSCREFLTSTLEICHRLVWTDEIAEEWKRHAASFARKWLVQMHARRKVDRIRATAPPGLQERACAAATTPAQEEEIRKDLRLIHAALVTDRLIVSLDDTVRGHLQQAVAKAEELKDVVWVNPNRPEEDAVEWLRAGAPMDPMRTLGIWRQSR